MDEQMISKAVESVIKQMSAGQDAKSHTCRCKKHKMTLALAKSLIGRVEQKAAEMGLAVVIAVSDQAGRITAVHCMDGAYIASYDIAVNKTYTSAGLKMSTAKLGELSQPGQPLYGIQFTNEGKIVIFGGGEPLESEGNIIGALGVSGGSAEEDTFLAAYGRVVLKEVISCL